MDYQGWYDLETNEFRLSQYIQFVASMAPPTGGRNSITQRYIRHYCKIYLENFDSESLNNIYSVIMQ